MDTDEEDFLSCAEVCVHLRCTQPELRRLLILGKLVPSYLINHVAYKVRFTKATDDSGEYWLPERTGEQVEDDTGGMRHRLYDTDGLYYLVHPERTAAMDCKFLYFSSDRNHTKGAGEHNVCFMLSGGNAKASRPITLEDVLEHGVVMQSELRRYEGGVAGNARSHPQKALSDAQSADICQQYKLGRKVAALARSFNVSRRTIDKVLGEANLKTFTPRKRNASGRTYRSGIRIK